MSKHFVMTFSVPVSDDLFAQAKVITAVEQAIDAFKGSLNGMDGYELTTDLIAKRAPKQAASASEKAAPIPEPHTTKRNAAA